jgi:AcrR family transcriptional regulator
VLREKGYANLTFEEIAARAQTGKAAIYRRWHAKPELIVAIIRHQGFHETPSIPDTGSLRGDMLVCLRDFNRRRGDAMGPVMSIMLGDFFDETHTTPAQLRMEILGERTSTVTEVVRRAIKRGELAGPLPPSVMNLPLDLLRGQIMMTFKAAPDDTIVDIVDTLFIPLATDPRRQGPANGPR